MGCHRFSVGKNIIRALDYLLAAYANGFIDRSGHRLVILSSRRFRGGWRLRRRSIVRRGCKVSFRLAPAWPDQRPANNADTAGQGACLHTKVRSIWRLALLLDAGPCLQESDHLELARRKAGGSIDRKSTRLNSSHVSISYAVFCLKKKT